MDCRVAPLLAMTGKIYNDVIASEAKQSNDRNLNPRTG